MYLFSRMISRQKHGRKKSGCTKVHRQSSFIGLIKMCESSVHHEIYTRHLTSIVLFLDAFMFTTFRVFWGAVELQSRHIYYCDLTHLTVTSRENCSQDLPVLLHLIKLPLQGALHMSIGHYVFHHVFLQRSPQCSLVCAIKLEPGNIR